MAIIMNDAQFDPDFDYQGFANRLADAMFPEKVTAFAARSGINQPTISKYLKAGGSGGPRLDLVARMAEALGCSIDWLVWGRGDGPESTTAGFVKIPRYDARLAAGAGSWNEGRKRIDYMPFSADFLQKRLGRASNRGLGVVEARGDSMEPTISNGGLLLVDEEDRRIVDGIFAFVLDGDARVKRIRKQVDGLMIISDNPAYPPERLSGSDLEKIHIIGRVLWVGQTL